MFKILLLFGFFNVAFSCAAIGGGGDENGGISDFAITNNPTFELHYRPPVKWTTAQTSSPSLGQSDTLNSATKTAQAAVRKALLRSMSKFSAPSSPIQKFDFKDLKGSKIDVFDNQMNAINNGGIVDDNTVVSICKKSIRVKRDVVDFDTSDTASRLLNDPIDPPLEEAGESSTVSTTEEPTTTSTSTEASTSSSSTIFETSTFGGSTLSPGSTASGSTSLNTQPATNSPATGVTTLPTSATGATGGTAPTTLPPAKTTTTTKATPQKCDSLEDNKIESSFTLKNGPLLSGKQWKDIADNMQNLLTDIYVVFDDDIIVKA